MLVKYVKLNSIFPPTAEKYSDFVTNRVGIPIQEVLENYSWL